ncbi:MAG: 50S ribosomal protein L1 [Opitutales bacterium]|jgi:large subunit ribosomal protein L1|tara:strand:- start:1350 stop:2036 length:687 start_codon:yes stop_codon:yes gene_type:complete
MIARSKRYKDSLDEELAEGGQELSSAVSKLAGFNKVKFDETVEVSFSLGVDPKQTSQAVRGTVNLPHGSGKEVKVLVFTENVEEAKSLGADFAGLEDLISKIKDGWLDFDVAVSTTSAMKNVRSIARVLGPRGLMPTPKSGTVTDNLEDAINQVKAGRVEFKMDKTGSLAVVIGKRSFSNEQLEENAQAALEAVVNSRPNGFKGRFIKTLYLSSTMSPSVQLDSSQYQ